MQKKFTLLCLLMALFAADMTRAQVLQDNFADGNFNANPTWGGNTADFIVNPAFELQLSAVVNTSTPRYLSVAANTSLADSTTWEFYSFQNLSPSTTNFGRVYLTSDNSDLTASLNGYYVKLGGTTGTTDALELYRQTGTTSTLICASAPSTMGGTTTTVRVRVTRNTSGVWELWADYSNGTNYILQGTGTDNTHASGSFFGVNCVFTTTRAAHFYFDDIYVSPLFVDATAPTLVSATATTATNVDALFSEPITAGTANNIANYGLNNGAAVSAAQIDGTNPRLVHLTTFAPLVSGTTYLLTTNNISDLSGNILNNGQQSFTYFNIQPAAVGDIVISEIMADPDPRVALPNLEYVELYNRSNKYINLQDYVFNEGSARILGAHIMPPNTYVLLTTTANIDSFVSTGTVLGLSGLGLTNGGEFLSLSDNLGNVIDSLTYSDTWYQDAVKKNGGWSLELINPNLICKGASNWIASNNAAGGTPNAQNSVFNNTPDTQAPSFTAVAFTSTTTVRLTFDDAIDRTAAQNVANYTFTGGVAATNAVFVYPNQVIVTVSPAFTNQSAYTVTVGSGLTDCVGNAIGANNNRSFTYYDILPAQFQDLIFNELMIDPDPAVGLPNAEYVELHNRANYAINLLGMNFIHVSTSSGAATVTTLTDYTLLPNDYVILYASASEPEFALLTNKRLVVTSFPSLNNTSASLILRTSSNQTIDSLTYTDAWYRDSNKKDGGWALELINPTQLCKESDNWRASSATAGGTPAAINSIFSLAPDLTPPTILGSRFVGNTQILIYTDKILDAATVADINNYTISGGLTITSANISNQRDIVLLLSTPMQHQSTYNIVIDGVEDCLDNVLSGTTALTYYDTEQALHYDILINEIFPDTDPQVGLPLKEYVELYNRSNKYINIQGFTFQDRSTSIAELPFYVLPPNAYLIVASNDDTVGFAQFGNYVLVANFPDLNVSSDDAILRDFLGNVIDAVAYEQSWYQNSTKAAGGWSLERINYNRPCEGASNWVASDNMLGGTPAQPNSVLQTTPDNSAPQLIRAFPPAANQIRLYFTEAVSDIDAININNYTLSPATAPLVLSAVVEPPFYSTVLVTLDADLQANTIYTLTLNAAYRDCIGTAITPAALSAQVALPVAAEANDLIINEILFNPVTGGSDFLELYNRSNKVINARSLILANSNADGNINQTQNVLTDYLIFPNQYLVITPDPDHIKDRYNPENPFWIIKNSMPTYDDSEATVWVYTTANSVATTIDKFSYNKTMHQALLADQNGVSLERISPEVPAADMNNWHSGASVVNYATPTYKNSSFRAGASPTDNLIDIPNPTFSPDGDGYEDFLLVNYDLDALGYVARVYIYDAQGRLVRRLTDGELFAQDGYLQWDGSDEKGFKATTGIYVVDIELTNPALGTIRRYKKTCVVASRL
jgi:hypothetical protein